MARAPVDFFFDFNGLMYAAGNLANNEGAKELADQIHGNEMLREYVLPVLFLAIGIKIVEKGFNAVRKRVV